MHIHTHLLHSSFRPPFLLLLLLLLFLNIIIRLPEGERRERNVEYTLEGMERVKVED